MTTPAISRSVGAWEISMDPITGVTAERRSNGELFSTSLSAFPIGYRVDKVWTNGVADVTRFVPQSVKSAANGMARQLTKEIGAA